ncbi:MAG: phosphoglycerate dehydrogenase [Candidatus Omnitrophica bacterium]|nr:phosphoglycerate dehydrogenase [Candidatus Omnitrophota bacterium]
MVKILVSDPLGKGGLSILRKEKRFQVEERYGLKPDELKKIIRDYDAIVIRSGTRLTKDILEAAERLRIIGRAGVGVDNVDLETATRRGIIVMNTPEGNTISTAEHAFSLLMALARNIPQACNHVKGGEWKKSQFTGSELNGKVLGIIGFGRIGREVAKRAVAFNMEVLAFDPFISKASVREFPVKFKDLNSLLKMSDFITVHTPLTSETKHLINTESLKLCKKGVRIINCARGGIIDELAVVEGIKSGKVAGAAFDVFEKEPPPPDHPFFQMPQVICTPHLGAATGEAQENVALDVARQVVDALADRAIKNAVNLPNLDPETLKVLRPWLALAEKLGKLHVQLFTGSVKTVTIRYGGELTKHNLEPLTIAVVRGLLTPICGELVNYVNAMSLAKERGITVNESKSTAVREFTSYIEVEILQGDDSNRITGTFFGNQMARVVRINEYILDVDPTGYVLFIHNEDQPGVVGTIGSILGKNKINIAEMSLGRVRKGKKMYAMTVINTDSEVPERVLTEIKKFSLITNAKVVKF